MAGYSNKVGSAGAGSWSKGVSKGGKGGKASKGSQSPALASNPSIKYELGPDDPPPYGDLRYSSTYWDARHAAVGDLPFDWYMGYERLRGILKKRLPPPSSNAEILDLGFGTSELPACLHADGWVNVTCIDTSVVAVTRARGARRHSGRTELQFLQMDACKTDFPEKCFDAIVDKALLDTLVTGGHSFPRVRDMLSEVYRLLRPGGRYFCVSHAAPSTRLPYLAHDAAKPWRIEVAHLEKPGSNPGQDDEGPEDAGGGYFHVYICTKSPGDAIDGESSEDDGGGAPDVSGGISPEMMGSSKLIAAPAASPPAASIAASSVGGRAPQGAPAAPTPAAMMPTMSLPDGEEKRASLRPPSISSLKSSPHLEDDELGDVPDADALGALDDAF